MSAQHLRLQICLFLILVESKAPTHGTWCAPSGCIPAPTQPWKVSLSSPGLQWLFSPKDQIAGSQRGHHWVKGNQICVSKHRRALKLQHGESAMRQPLRGLPLSFSAHCL